MEPSLIHDFTFSGYWDALGTAIVHGLQVLLAVGTVGAALTFLSGGTQPKHWPSKAEH